MLIRKPVPQPKSSILVAFVSLKISFNAISGATIDRKHDSKVELGNISGKFTWGNSIVPVFSIGYDSSFYSDSMMTFNFEIGGMYVGKSKIDVTSSGLMSKHLDNVIDEANQTLNTELEQYQKYLYIIPIIKAGIRFNF